MSEEKSIMETSSKEEPNNKNTEDQFVFEGKEATLEGNSKEIDLKNQNMPKEGEKESEKEEVIELKVKEEIKGLGFKKGNLKSKKEEENIIGENKEGNTEIVESNNVYEEIAKVNEINEEKEENSFEDKNDLKKKETKIKQNENEEIVNSLKKELPFFQIKGFGESNFNFNFGESLFNFGESPFNFGETNVEDKFVFDNQKQRVESTFEGNSKEMDLNKPKEEERENKKGEVFELKEKEDKIKGKGFSFFDFNKGNLKSKNKKKKILLMKTKKKEIH
jgi:hypothetical protein